MHLDNTKTIQAKDSEAIYQNKKIIGGNLDIIRLNGIDFTFESNHSLFIFAYDNEIKAIFEMKDKIKKDGKKYITLIQNMGIKTIMLTGDNSEVAKEVAKEINIQTYKANLLPQDKLKIVQHYQEKDNIVVMAGDGINDSLSLARSDIAIAMGSGADIAINASDIVLIDDELKNLYFAYKISHRAFQGVKENLFLSVLYNTVAIPLAVLGYVNPLIAALSMSLSSLLVVANSFRIKHFGKYGIVVKFTKDLPKFINTISNLLLTKRALWHKRANL